MRGLLRSLASAITGFSWSGQILGELGLFILLVIVFWEVIARYVFRSPTVFSVELSEYLMTFLTFMGIGWVLKENRHVRVEVLYVRLPKRVQNAHEIALSVLVLVFCAVLVWKGAATVIMTYTSGYRSSGMMNFPLWITYAIIPTGALALGLQYLVKIGGHVKALMEKEKTQEGEA